ncbi:F-box protein SKIP5 isoform X2 [Dendrobium catenatum]|uniref:F-box protein SKIP5 isoform X2 n=1 Tax=Dendrobium catenatum TaxID=906689 RepID=UPI0010A07938|nr:F-box protein SKIP5 isoform X2 [Dendrobium catenatum]
MGKRQRTIAATPAAGLAVVTSPINSLDDGCLMHIFSFLSPIPDRHNTALVCHKWRYLACHPRHWLRIESSIKRLAEPGVYSTLEAAVAAARPGDTILISAGGNHIAHNIQIKKPLCLIGGGKLPDDTVLTCLRGSESALEFFSTCKVANLTVRAELGCCLLHRSGRLMVEGCILQWKRRLPCRHRLCHSVKYQNRRRSKGGIDERQLGSPTCSGNLCQDFHFLLV